MMLDATDAKTVGDFTKTQACALVLITSARGSTPRLPGTKMLVSQTGQLGTIGGGQLEYLAVEAARELLAAGQKERHPAVPLGPAIGQCCGGHIELEICQLTAEKLQTLIEDLSSETASQPDVFIFGAGHVGRALAIAMRPLPLSATVIDVRKEELDLLPDDIPKVLAAVPETYIRNAKPGTAIVVLTHDHALDFLLASEALARDDLSYIGMIGSSTKRATFKSWLQDQGLDMSRTDRLTMPIGASVNKDKRPAVIAALTAAELLASVASWQPVQHSVETS